MSKDKKTLSDALARRLPAYYRHVCVMKSEGINSVTSGELANRIGNTSAQVRQDFFTCGGVDSYNTETLKTWLAGLLGLNRKHHMVVVGAGNLGRAIISFKEFNEDGFFIDAVFDSSLMFEGMQICGVPIINAALFEDYLAENSVDIVVITAPAGAAADFGFDLANRNVHFIMKNNDLRNGQFVKIHCGAHRLSRIVHKCLRL